MVQWETTCDCSLANATNSTVCAKWLGSWSGNCRYVIKVSENALAQELYLGILPCHAIVNLLLFEVPGLLVCDTYVLAEGINIGHGETEPSRPKVGKIIV
jgi:hypothetical protein